MTPTAGHLHLHRTIAATGRPPPPRLTPPDPRWPRDPGPRAVRLLLEIAAACAVLWLVWPAIRAGAGLIAGAVWGTGA